MAENALVVTVNGVRAERLNFDEVAGDTVTVVSSQGNTEGATFVSKVSEDNGCPMDVDVGSVETAALEDRQKGLGKPGVTSSDANKVLKKQLKRKRASNDCDVNSFDKEALITKCRQEYDELFEYYKEFSGLMVPFEDGTPCSLNSTVALLLEERNVSFSKLVDEIYEKIKARDGVTLALVRQAVLSVGQRLLYGISNADIDVLEDESESCLWCWEARDLKLLPKLVRGTVSMRRTARKMIHGRVSVLSEALSVLSNSECSTTGKNNLVKISAKLGKALNKEAISSMVEKLNQKNCTGIAEKEAKLKEKEIVKTNRSAEKEKMKLDRELQKEKLRNEKELKRMQDDSRREEKRREKEEAELQKQAKKQQEEAFREQQRREKEEAELKKQLAVQKQASIMERFLKSKKSGSGTGKLEKTSPLKGSLLEKSSNAELVDSATTSMDCAFAQQSALSIEDLRRFHLASWHKIASYNRSCHWGIRQKPKAVLVKELKLQRPSFGDGMTPVKESSLVKVTNDNDVDPTYDKVDDELESFLHNGIPCESSPIVAQTSVCAKNKKLLQFDKSFRPAYYGTWQKKSNVINPRNPLKKDPDLDYEIDSDEEWEEEDPGESLSDCDKDNEESLEEESMKNKDDEDESEDSFVVPDGYLSENEGVEVEISSVPVEDDTKFSLSSNLEDVGEEFQTLLRQQRVLTKLTEKALRKTQPLVISNLNHEKMALLLTEDLSGTDKIEQVCLQALSMRICSSGAVIDLPANFVPEHEHREVHQFTKETSAQATPTPTPPSPQILDSDLPEFVKSIQSCPHGINKIVEALHQKFPALPKTQLKRKVKEISDFVDNRWQVKEDILAKAGLHGSPSSVEKGRSRKRIGSYFFKRCLPPAKEAISISETTPEKCSISEADCVKTEGQH